MNINELLLGEDSKESKEYKSGWCDAVCYLHDNFVLQKRNGEPIEIIFDIGFDEKLIKEFAKNGKAEC